MDPLRQPQAQKIIRETWPTIQINGKAVYPWREGNTLFLVGEQKGVLYYELLKPGETINGQCYRIHLIHLKRTVAEKRPQYATRRSNFEIRATRIKLQAQLANSLQKIFSELK